MKQNFWNKVKQVADELGIPDVRFRQWKHVGAVPAKWHFSMMEAAKRRRISLTIKELSQRRNE